MNKKKMLLVIVLAFALLLGGAGVLYRLLGESVAPEQLAQQQEEETHQGSGEEQDASGAEDTAETQESADEEVPEPPKAPDFIVYDAQGNEVRLSDYLGKPIVLNFWASWCGPCQGEMPDFHEKYLEVGENIHFLMINVTDGSRETVETARSFLEEKGYGFPAFYDTDIYAASVYGAYSLPRTFFINAEGYVIAQANGPIDGETLQTGIDMIV